LVENEIRQRRAIIKQGLAVDDSKLDVNTMSKVLDFDEYTIAWVAVLPIEAEAALGMLDKQHDGYFETVQGDDYIYIGGELNGHKIVIATWPIGQNYGPGAAAALVNQVKARFSNIWFALLVGVAAGLPNHSPEHPTKLRDIRLGDVLVCVPDKDSVGIIQYDLGRDTEEGFFPNGRQAETPAIVRSAIGNIQLTKKRPFRVGNTLANYLAIFQQADEDGRFLCPSQSEDKLFTGLEHALVTMEPRDESERTKVWYGNMGSGSSLMRNPIRRDELRDKYDLIGLEMEAAGIMNTLTTGVIRGVCDYGDSEKNKIWQPYAAAAAAAYAKGILCAINPKVKAQTGQIVKPWLGIC
jgi:nucleoside phosphorylase